MADLKKYKIFKNNNFEVLTHEGFKDFDGIMCGENKNKVKLTFSDNQFLICTPKHKIILKDESIIYAKDLKLNDVVFDGSSITNISNFENDDKVYELLNVHDTHKYLVNTKLSHQCIVIDEMAFIPNNFMDDFWKSTIPVVSSSKKSKIFAVSCVTEDTQILTKTGIKQVKDFIESSKTKAYNVSEYSVYGKNKFNYGDIMFNNGRTNTKKIETINSQLECSLIHKLWSCKDGVYGWHKEEELSVGDYIAIQYGKNI